MLGRRIPRVLRGSQVPVNPRKGRRRRNSQLDARWSGRQEEALYVTHRCRHTNTSTRCREAATSATAGTPPHTSQGGTEKAAVASSDKRTKGALACLPQLGQRAKSAGDGAPLAPCRGSRNFPAI
ncbi:hypothetical protein MTO96_003729 [Rhipicephalus appendiculatus]